MRLAALVVFLCFITPHAYSFEVSGNSWQFPTSTFYVGITGNSASGESWNSAFKRAMTEWSTATSFDFIAIDETLDPCIDRTRTTFGDGITGVDFSPTQCSSSFGSNVLAVTLLTLDCLNNTCSGGKEITDSDIVFNSDINWDIYSGTLQNDVRDFHRVALHELGHALGLDHESNSVAIMQPLISNIDSLQADDIEGANFIYGGDITIPSIYGLDIILPVAGEIITSSNSITLNGTLTQSDQILQNRPIDLYQFRLANDYTIDMRLSSNDINSLLYLVRVNSSQEIIPEFSFSNDNFGFGQNARIVETLEAGTYWAGASGGNNFDFGNYTLSLIANIVVGGIGAADSFESIYGAEVQINPNPVIEGDLSESDFILNDRFLDIYQITVESETRLRFDLSSNVVDTKLLLVEIKEDQSVGQVSLINDDNGGGTNSRIESALQAGTYWIGVTSFNSNETGNYRIDTTVVIP